ncbi:MAG: hypothetical protein NTY19_02610 [Planctomycetota bacterium]|nr:hypothetical protein [Planctomycetota bacterium]
MRSVLAFVVTVGACLGQLRSGCSAELAAAHTVYLDKLTKTDEGVHRAEGLLFVIVELPDASKLREETLQSRCLLRTIELLRQYASDQPRPADVAAQEVPPANPVLQQFSFLLAECRRANPRFGTRNFELQDIASRTLENRPLGKKRRYVTAFAEADFDKQRDAKSSVAPDVPETLAILRPRLAALLEDESEQAATLLLRSGAIEDVLNVVNDESQLEFSLASFGEFPWDSLEFYERCQAGHDLVTAPNTSVAEVRQFLRNWPGFPPALRWLRRSYDQEQKPAMAVNFGLLALVDAAKADEGHRELIAVLDRWAKTDPSALGLTEYSRLLASVQPASLPDAVRLPEHPATQLVTRVWRTCGHLNLPEAASESRASEPASTVDRVRKAKDLTAAVKLAYDGLAKDPADAALWAAFGETLLTAEETAAAIPFLTQSLRLAPTVVRTRLSLATCYERLGHQQLRRGLALAAMLQPAVTDTEREQALAHLSEATPATTKKSASATPTDGLP